jgi:hypothetical protein
LFLNLISKKYILLFFTQSYIPNESFIEKSKTEVLYDVEISLDIGVTFMQKAKAIDIVEDKKGPTILIEYDVYKKNLIDAQNRGTKMRYLVDITKRT